MAQTNAPSEQVVGLRQMLERQTGAVGESLPSAPGVTLYKVAGKMFAILATGRREHVTLKCDPHLADILRGEYQAIGKRTHLDPRHWITIDLAADVPPAEIQRLAAHSYDLVCSGLTRRQRADLAARNSGDAADA